MRAQGSQTCHAGSVVDEESLGGTSEDLALLIAQLPVPVAVLAEGAVVVANPALGALLGSSPDELVGRTVEALVHPGAQACIKDWLARSVAGEELPTLSATVVTASGVDVHVDVSATATAFHGRPAALWTLHDTSRRMAAEEALRTSEARWRALVQHGSDLIVVVDEDARFTYVSPSARTILRRDPDELIGTSALTLIHPDDVPATTEALRWRFVDPGMPHASLRVRALAGEGAWRWLDLFASNRLHDPDVGGMIVNAWDVSEQVAAEERLRHLALHDSLTGLPNRVLLAERLDAALEEGRASGTVTGLLMLDLDRFKDVNDTLGHESGDRVLAAMAARLTVAVREHDVVGRIGGDEFGVVLPCAQDAATVERIARRILAACNEPVLHEGMHLRVGASIGMVLAPEHGDEPSMLLRRVDAAMYRAKEHRLGVVAASEGDLEGGRRRLAVADELRLAFERDELFCVYQPKADLGTGRVVGVEALVRWQHPVRGVIGPDQFLPDVEQLGFMAHLTRDVLREALTHLAAWTAAGLGITVAVNVSATMLHHPDLVPTVEELLAETGADPSLLVVEITEQAAMVQPEVSLQTMAALREWGIGFSIDDFGTGQSSLTHLRLLPVTEVKIDRSFISKLHVGTPDAAIARSVVDLAHNLGMRTVAEGIETVDVLDLVRSWDCDLGQGWHLGAPTAAELVPEACRVGVSV